jgi:predicted nucleotidyltransferase
MNTVGSTNTAIALFGSVARRDGDRLSDKDVLVINDDASTAKSLAHNLRFTGWSPVAYSWRRFEAAARSKRLFIQHLRQDAKIVRDIDGRLRETLRNFRPRFEYLDELRSAEEFLTLPSAIPNCTRGLYWSLDVLAVGLRNFGILRLAHEGIYRFSLCSILNALVSIGTLKSTDVGVLIRLRDYKHMYRARRFHAKFTFREVANVVNLVSDRIGIATRAKKASAEDIVHSALFPTKGSEWYQQARRLEAALFALRPNRSDSELCSFRSEIEHAVTSPADYGWTIKLNAARISDQLWDIAGSRPLENW